MFLSLVKLNQTETEHDGSLLIKLMIFGVFIDDNSFRGGSYHNSQANKTKKKLTIKNTQIT